MERAGGGGQRARQFFNRAGCQELRLAAANEGKGPLRRQLPDNVDRDAGVPCGLADGSEAAAAVAAVVETIYACPVADGDDGSADAGLRVHQVAQGGRGQERILLPEDQELGAGPEWVDAGTGKGASGH